MKRIDLIKFALQMSDQYTSRDWWKICAMHR